MRWTPASTGDSSSRPPPAHLHLPQPTRLFAASYTNTSSERCLHRYWVDSITHRIAQLWTDSATAQSPACCKSLRVDRCHSTFGLPSPVPATRNTKQSSQPRLGEQTSTCPHPYTRAASKLSNTTDGNEVPLASDRGEARRGQARRWRAARTALTEYARAATSARSSSSRSTASSPSSRTTLSTPPPSCPR